MINTWLVNRLLITTGCIAILTALWHLLCIFGGLNWFVFARAPSIVIQSVQQGTLLAPILTIIIALLMFISALYAFSCAGIIRKLPWLKTATITISFLCLLRVILVVPLLWVNHFNDLWQVIATTLWLFVGMSFLFAVINLFSESSFINNRML